MKLISNHIQNSINALENLKTKSKQIETISKLIEKKIKSGKKIFVYCYGGSFADASHFVGELTATYNKKGRKGLPFYLLSSNLSSVTAWSNDFNFKDYVSRELSCYAQNGWSSDDERGESGRIAKGYSRCILYKAFLFILI